jgi:hypothetical protein
MTIGCGISHRNTTHVYKYNSKQFTVSVTEKSSLNKPEKDSVLKRKITE